MTILEQFLRDGDRLFRWRSYFPLVLVPVLVAGVLVNRPPFATMSSERAWEVFSVLVALSGLAIRAWAVGTAPAGTSERSTVSPRASQLRTSGLYSMVRHPLYLANGLMAVPNLIALICLSGVIAAETKAHRDDLTGKS